jgi:hypothetical protein
VLHQKSSGFGRNGTYHAVCEPGGRIGVQHYCANEQHASRARGILTALVSVLAASACQRQAPGPEECEAVAVQLIRTAAARQLARGAELSIRESDVEAIALECLTTPFDRKLVDCVVERRGEPRACIAAFKDRRIRESSSGW